MTGAAASFFGKIADDVADAAEQISNVIEEGASIMFGGSGGIGGSDGAGSRTTTTPGEGTSGSFEVGEDDFAMGEEEMMHSPLEGIADSVLGDIMRGQTGPSTPLEHVQAFRSAIDWSEPFVLSLIGFQIVMFLLTILAVKSNSLPIRMSLMIFIGILVRCAERLNSYGAEHWEDFATQNYFDRRGVFVGIMLCAPLILDCFFMLICFLREASRLLVEVKKRELQRKKKATTSAAGKGGGAGKKRGKGNTSSASASTSSASTKKGKTKKED